MTKEIINGYSYYSYPKRYWSNMTNEEQNMLIAKDVAMAEALPRNTTRFDYFSPDLAIKITETATNHFAYMSTIEPINGENQ